MKSLIPTFSVGFTTAAIAEKSGGEGKWHVIFRAGIGSGILLPAYLVDCRPSAPNSMVMRRHLYPDLIKFANMSLISWWFLKGHPVPFYSYKIFDNAMAD